MTEIQSIPEFAILGHPNEGKSSLVSTLTEDDSVNISPYPGETRTCRIFPVIIDGNEVIRFTDTPGFQAPRQTLAWFENYAENQQTIIDNFIVQQKNNPVFKDETELLSPLQRGAGIIYVADGSRPLRNNDRAEMKILALTQRPRVAIINNKTDDIRYNASWEDAFQEHFDRVIYFNAHHASYRERLYLLEELKAVNKAYTKPLSRVISVYKGEWSQRNLQVAENVISMIETCLSFKISESIVDKSMKDDAKNNLMDHWNKKIRNMEQSVHSSIRKQFKHNIFNVQLSDDSLLTKDLFDSATWKLLGLSRGQLAAAAATVGGATAFVFDLALAGHALGLFTLIGGAAGAGTALLGAKKIGKARVLGKAIGGYNVTVGPHRDMRFMFILLDRALLFYSHVINWAHGKRSRGPGVISETASDQHGRYLSSRWSKETRSALLSFFSKIGSKKHEEKELAKKQAIHALKDVLDRVPYQL